LQQINLPKKESHMIRKAALAPASFSISLATIFVAFGSPLTALAQHGSLQAAQPRQAPIIRAAAAQDDADGDCDHLLKASVSGPSSITGSAELCIDRNHTTVSEWAENAISGHAYTTWFAYIDDPAQCGHYPGGTPGVCSDPDGVLPAASPTVVFGRMDGAVAGSSGRLHMTGAFRGLHFSHGSIVWIIMFEHGPASTSDNRFLARQLLTPQLPPLGPPGLGAPADGNIGHPVALAVFNIP
jgi:hypothetical protein